MNSTIDTKQEQKDRPPQSPTANDTPKINNELLIDIIGDEYTQAILIELTNNGKTARAISNSIKASRPTIYRRLNKLVRSGIVSTTTELNEDGHHRDKFHLKTDSLEFKLTDSGIEINTQINT